MGYEMLIKEIFHFQNGKTIFVGEITGDSKFIRQGIWEIKIDNELVGTVEIEGEMHHCNSTSKLRSLSTKDNIDISQIPYKTAKVVLKSIT